MNSDGRNDWDWRAALKRANAAPPPERTERDERVEALRVSGEISAADWAAQNLFALLKVDGESVEVDGLGRVQRLPSWIDGLFIDDAGIFHYRGQSLTRPQFNRCIYSVKPHDAPKLMHALVASGAVCLGDRSMEGVVAEVWSHSEPRESGLVWDQWVILFRANGFCSEGRRIDPPTNPLDLYRGATQDDIFGMAWTTAFDVARRFASKTDGEGREGRVYTARVESQFLLAFIDGTSGLHEKEWIVDPVGGLSDANVKRI